MSWLRDAENKRQQTPKPLTDEEKLKLHKKYFDHNEAKVNAFLADVAKQWGAVEDIGSGMFSGVTGVKKRFAIGYTKPHISENSEYGVISLEQGKVRLIMWTGKGGVHKAYYGKKTNFSVHPVHTAPNSEQGSIEIKLDGEREVFGYSSHSIKTLEELKPIIAKDWAEGKIIR